MENKGRWNRRLAGMLRARLPEAKLGDVADPRKRRGRRWPLATLLRAVVVSMLAGAKSLAAVENLTAEMGRAMAHLLGLPRRVPDTTLRALLCHLDPTELRRVLVRVVRAAHRRKALAPVDLPFGVVAMDGKSTSLPSCDDLYAQRQTQPEGKLVGVVRTVTCTLISSAAKVCLDANPIPASTNEMGHFANAFRELHDTYRSLDLFRMVSSDAGACSLENADLVRASSLHYLFGLKGSQPTLLKEAERLLGSLPATARVASSEDVVGGNIVTRRAFLTEEMAGFEGWTHLTTVIRIESETCTRTGERLAHENRYYLASLKRSRLNDAQWLRLIRLHWGVENNCHNTLDTAFAEDDHPWIESSPQGALAAMLLRRVALTLLALFRCVTQRSDERRAMPWADVMRGLYNALIGATAEQLRGLRTRGTAVPV